MDGSAAPTSHRDAAHRVELGLACAGLYGLVGLVALRVRGGAAPLRVDGAVSHVVGTTRLGRVITRLHLNAPWPPGGARNLVAFGLPAAGAGIVLGLAALAWSRRDGRAMALCLVGPASALLLTDSVLKPLVGRHRGPSLAYPSGHATGAAAVAVLALVLFHRWHGWRATAWVAPVALALPAVMGLALVRLGFHYPTDVLGGTAMGAATVVAIAVLVDAQRPVTGFGR